MPNRSIRDIIQGTAHSLGLAKEDPPVEGFTPADDPPATPAAAPPAAASTGVPAAAGALQNRGSAIDKAVDAAS
jgi:hypothetical protein